jgi:hypothetical protein
LELEVVSHFLTCDLLMIVMPNNARKERIRMNVSSTDQHMMQDPLPPGSMKLLSMLVNECGFHWVVCTGSSVIAKVLYDTTEAACRRSPILQHLYKKVESNDIDIFVAMMHGYDQFDEDRLKKVLDRMKRYTNIHTQRLSEHAWLLMAANHMEKLWTVRGRKSTCT